MKVALLELVDAVAVLVGRLALLGGAVAAFTYCWLVVSDWFACEGKWSRCTKCGRRTKAKE
jgi:hypothetical protein